MFHGWSVFLGVSAQARPQPRLAKIAYFHICPLAHFKVYRYFDFACALDDFIGNVEVDEKTWASAKARAYPLLWESNLKQRYR